MAQRTGSEQGRAQILSLSLLVGLNFCDSSMIMGSYNKDLLGDEMNQGNTCKAFGKVLVRQTALRKYICHSSSPGFCIQLFYTLFCASFYPLCYKLATLYDLDRHVVKFLLAGDGTAKMT